MRIIALFFLLGTLSIQIIGSLPPLAWVLVLSFSSFFLTVIFKNRLKRFGTLLIGLTAFSAGLFYATLSAQHQLDNRLARDLQGKDIVVTGKVVDIPNSKGDGTRFRFEIQTAILTETQETIDVKGVVRLGWYQSAQAIHAAENWQLRIRLKQPSGFMNLGGFDYEKWLFTERIIATGYVRKSKLMVNENKLLKGAPWWSLNHIREEIHQTIQSTVENKSSAAVLSALVVAVRTKLNDEQWKNLQLTGTSHLVAISGLHISVVAGFALIPLMMLLRFFPTINERMPRRIVAGILGILFATAYAMLAGFTLPTQRALLIVVIGVLGLVGRKHYSSSTVLAGALLGVLILDPLAGMTISFWLSFLAVALILSFLNRQLGTSSFSLIKLQLVLSLGMLPLTLYFFGTISLTSPVANLFAIPWVSVIIVPLSLLGMVFIPISSFVSAGLFNIAALAIDWLFKGLAWLGESSLAKLTLAEVPDFYLILMFIGMLFLLLPKGFPAKWLGFLTFIPALFFTTERPKQGEFTYTLLDVGQGMASVLQTKKHTLVFDAGTRISDSFDIGKLVVVPYLRAKGIKQLDRLVISHEDIDHRGGAQAILDNIKIKQVISSDANILPNVSIESCVQGQTWKWDGVTFAFVSPPLKYQQNDNNRSCVLRVSNQLHSVLITADIEKQAEQLLLDGITQKQLNAEVMTIPHHGSRTSSSVNFINGVSPTLALVTAGYRNRFGHPKKDVLERYRKKGITLLSTVSSGAIEINFPATNEAFRVNQFRVDKKGFWSRK